MRKTVSNYYARTFALADDLDVEAVLNWLDPDWRTRCRGALGQAARFYAGTPRWAEAVREVTE